MEENHLIFGEPNSFFRDGFSISVFPFLVSFRLPELGRRKVVAAGAEVALMANWGAHCGAEVFFSLWRMLYVRKFVWSSPHKILKCRVSSFACAFLKWSNKALCFFPQGVSKEDRNKHPQLLQFGLLPPEINLKLEKKSSRLFKRKHHFPKFDDHFFAHAAHAKIEKIAFALLVFLSSDDHSSPELWSPTGSCCRTCTASKMGVD